MDEVLTEELEKVILKKICQTRPYPKSFEEIIRNLEKKFNEFNPIQNSSPIEPYFGQGRGEETAKKLLIKDGKIKSEWLRPYSTKEGKEKIDFRGLYIFVYDTIPIYAGISKGVIGRVYQHLKGRKHFSASLAFKIGLLKYEFENGSPYLGKRADLDFIRNVEPIQRFLMNQKIALLSIENIEELYLFEIYCSMKLGTWLNDFETH